MTSISAPTPFARAIALRGQHAQDRLQPVVADVVEMVGLGGGEQDAVDARAEDRAQRRGAPGAEGAQHLGQRVFEIAHRRRAGIERAERIDQHDLAVEAAEMVAEERLDDVGLIRLVAPLHHRRQRARSRLDVSSHRQRREGQRRRAFEIAGHQEAAGRQGRERIGVATGGAQIFGEQRRRGARDVFVELGIAGRGRRDWRARRRRAARGPARGSPQSSRSTSGRRICRATSGRAAIRRGNRRCRDRAAPAPALQPAARA